MAKRTPTRPRHASRGPKAAPRPRKAAAKKARPSRAASRAKMKAPKKASPKKTAPKRAAPRKAASKNAAPRKATPKTTVPKKAALRTVAPKKRQAAKRPAPKTGRVARSTPKPAPARTRSRPPRAATRARANASTTRPAPAAAPPREPKTRRTRPRFEVPFPLEPLAISPIEDANGLPSNATPSSLSADVRRPARARAGRNGTEAGGEAESVLTGGDVDANWEVAYSSGDEAPGGDNPTPDQDDADAIGRALGVEYDDNEELQGADKIAERDRHRWELDPASSDDYKARGR